MANFTGSGGLGSFQSPELRNRSSGGFGAAAGITDASQFFAENRKRAPRYDQMTATNIANRAAEVAESFRAEAEIRAQGLTSMANIKAANIAAEAAEEAADTRAGAAKSSATMQGIGAVVGAGLSLLSDETTKENIKGIDDALTVLRQLKPVSFYYKEDYTISPERKHYGFIAQDYVDVMPDATYYDESIGKMCIDTSELIGLLVKSVQQLEARVQYLEASKALAGVK
jgi:hypothetical protein